MRKGTGNTIELQVLTGKEMEEKYEGRTRKCDSEKDKEKIERTGGMFNGGCIDGGCNAWDECLC